jgi:hypothetical protein
MNNFSKGMALSFAIISSVSFAGTIPDCETYKCPASDPEIHHLQGVITTNICDNSSSCPGNDTTLYICAEQCKSGKFLGFASPDLEAILLKHEYDMYSGDVVGLSLQAGQHEGDPEFACIDVKGATTKEGMQLYSALAFKGARYLNSVSLTQTAGTFGGGGPNCKNLPSDLYYFHAVSGKLTGY